MRTLSFIFILLGSFGNIMFCQQNAHQLDPLAQYKLGTYFFTHSLYGPARHAQNNFIHRVSPVTDFDFSLLTDDAHAMSGISGMRLDLPSGENELIKFISSKYPDPTTVPAIQELGSYYYNQRWFKKCITTFAMLDPDNLSEYDMTEVSFKKGYAHFALKEFELSKKELSRIKEIRNEFYYPSNYYYGLCDYFNGNYNGAITSFEKIKNSDTYRSFVPFYLAQIYFAQNKYEQVIQMGEQALVDEQLRNRKEIRQLIGQAYFNTEKYSQALPHLEYYESNTDKLTIEEFFQLAFTQYQLKKYKDAIKNFRELHLLDNRLGQLVNYYLADCYYKTGDLTSARAAFKKVSQMDFEKKMQHEALFNYGKLSAEVGYEREAINTLSKIEKTSPYSKEADKIIGALLENMTDYVAVLQIIEDMTAPTEKIKITFQNAALKLGMQAYISGKTDEAIKAFEKSKKYNLSKSVQAQNTFWISQIMHEKGNYKASIKGFEDFFDITNGMDEPLPEESSIMSGHYTQGYNFLILKDYWNAEKSFKNALVAFNLSTNNIHNKDLLNKIWPDAIIRTGDCLFKSKKYQDAIGFYQQAILKKQGNFVYALYQKAMIEGLSGNNSEKIISLKALVKDYPASDYADDALMQLGDTYFEMDNIESAYVVFSDLVDRYKSSPLKNAALLKLGLIAYNKGDLNTALKHYKTVMQTNPSAKEAESALLSLQEIYINDLGKAEEYVAYLGSLPGYKVSDTTADSLAFMVGVLRYNEGEYAKAVMGFNNYFASFPNGINKIKAHYYRAESNTLLKNYNEGLVDYELLIKLGHSEFYIQSLRKAALISYNYTQTFDKAYTYYNSYYDVLTDDDEKYKAALGALRSAFRISNSEGIKKHATIVIHSKKSDDDDKSTAYYYLAKTYYKENDLPQAYSAFALVGDKINSNQTAESRYMMAEILYKQKDLEKAEKQCNNANEKNAAYPFWIAKSLILLSDIYVVKNDLFNARSALEAVIENFPEDQDLLNIARSKLKSIEELEKQKNRIKVPSNNLIEFHQRGF